MFSEVAHHPYKILSLVSTKSRGTERSRQLDFRLNSLTTAELSFQLSVRPPMLGGKSKLQNKC